MSEAYIVGAVRSPIGKRNGGLSAVHPADLAAHVLRELIARTGVDPSAVEDVIMGCVSQVGPQAVDIARTAWLSAGLPETVPGVTIDRQCGSSQQAIHFAAQGVLSGTQDLVIAAGVESMSMVPMGSTVALRKEGMALPFGQGWRDRYGDQEISQFRGAQLMCEKWGIKRAELEEFSLQSHTRAIRAIDEGRFDREITPVGGVTTDEGPRRDSTLEKMAELKPLRPGWELTAATASQISDGVGGTADRLARCRPPARLHSAGPDPHARGHRLGSRLHADRPDPGDRAGTRQGTPVDRRHRRLRGQRGVRAGADRLVTRHRTRRWRRPTPTAARSLSATRSVPRARS